MPMNASRRFHRSEHLRRLGADEWRRQRDVEVAQHQARRAAAPPPDPAWDERPFLPPPLVCMDLWDSRAQVMRHMPPLCTSHLSCHPRRPAPARYVMGDMQTVEPWKWAIPIQGLHDWLCPDCMAGWICRHPGHEVKWMDWQQGPLF